MATGGSDEDCIFELMILQVDVDDERISAVVLALLFLIMFLVFFVFLVLVLLLLVLLIFGRCGFELDLLLILRLFCALSIIVMLTVWLMISFITSQDAVV